MTGASSGTGVAGALELASPTDQLVLPACNGAKLREVAHPVRASGGLAEIVPTDLEMGQVGRLVGKLPEGYPTVVNVAGLGVFSGPKLENVERQLRINLIAPAKLNRIWLWETARNLFEVSHSL